MKLSVVIINYNVKYFLEQTLLSVRKASLRLQEAYPGYDTEVLVVDNNSVDGSVTMLREKFPEVKLLANEENVGFARANNQALGQVSGEYSLLLNPDTVVEEDTFIKVIAFMEAHPEAGGLGVKMLDGKGKFLPESKRGFPSPEVAFYKAFGLSSLFPNSRIFGKYHLGYLDKDETHKVDVLAGAFMLIRTQVLNEVGYLDETFFMYGEDIDFSYRIKQAGYENYYYPETRIIHYKGESTKKQSVNYVFVFYKAMIIFARKHFSARKAAIFSFLLNLAIYFRASLALTFRFAKQMALPVVDFLLLTGGIYVLVDQVPGLVNGDFDPIPPNWLYYQLPIGGLLWILGSLFTRNYQKPFTPGKIVNGTLLGTLVVAAAYAFLPDSLQYSRGLILWGGLMAGIAFILTRLVYHYKDYGNFRLGSKGLKKIIIIGEKAEADRVEQLLRDSRVRFQLVGYVSPEEKEPGQANPYLGDLSQLGEISTIYDVNEIIFCAKDVPSQEIINWMVFIRDQQIDFKIAPEESLFIIGSRSKNLPGDFYTINIELGLAQPVNRFHKSTFDVLTALGLLLISPLVVLFVKEKKGFFRNLWQVLTGRNSWVGYKASKQTYQLPELKQGVLSPCDELEENHLDPDTIERLNFLYARDYEVTQDLKILTRNFSRLGEQN